MVMMNTTAQLYTDTETATGNKRMIAEGSSASIVYVRNMIEHYQGAINEQVKSRTEPRVWLAQRITHDGRPA